MRLLMLLLTVMTWTVASKNKVEGEGSWPYDMEVTYANTYTKGNVRAGDTAVISFSHLDGITLSSVQVYMTSNQSSGAGILSLSAEGQTVDTKTGSFKDWTGSFDNQSARPVSLTPSSLPLNSFSITLVGTANSLHIEKYVISFEMQSPLSVSLLCGADPYLELTESQRGSGVILPSAENIGEWQFIGWTPFDIWTSDTLPTYYPPQTLFHPAEPCVLHALYAFSPQTQTAYADTLWPGTYIYLDINAQMAVMGAPDNGYMTCASLDPTNVNAYYYIDFNAARDTAYITHLSSASPVGYDGAKIVEKPSPWCVLHEGTKTVFYAVSKNSTYVLFPTLYSGVMRTGLYATPNISSAPMALLSVVPQTTSYTCYPLRQDIASPEANTHTYTFPFGPFRLVISKGKKQLRL